MSDRPRAGTPLRPRPCGDDLVTVAVADAGHAQRLAKVLRDDPVWLEAVPGQDSVVVQFDPAVTGPGEAVDRLRRVRTPGPLPRPSQDLPPLAIPVRYGGADGPDLDAVCRELGLTRAEFIAAHSAGDHRVAMLGFTPGFAYVAGLGERLAVQRLARPRQRVPAGSVGIAGEWTGLYALAGPGGWPLVGRTALPLFDPAAADPFRLAPGQRVRFVPVDGGEDP